MKNKLILALFFAVLAFAGCSDDDTNNTPVSVAFAVTSVNLSDDATQVQVLFSDPTPSAGSLTVTFEAAAVTYGTDFSTVPAANGNTVIVPFDEGVSTVSFTFNKLINAIEGQVKNVTFTVADVSFDAVISGNHTVQLNFNETPSLGAALAAEVGGPLQQNQVYVDLSSGATTAVPRVSWDLGFYSGSTFKVAINGSLKMAAKQLQTNNIDEIQAADETMLIFQGQGVANQIDNPDGNISGTAIAEVSANDNENKVYLINMGSNPATAAPAVGSEGSGSGSSRGWKKIRIIRSGNDYKMQYADIDATTHQEVTISKNAAYNFTFFSLTTNGVVNVEPQKSQWDLNFTTFTNLLGGTTPYYFPDFIVSNLKGGAKAYMVMVSESVTYDNFALANVTEASFTEDQRNIGSNWRSTSVNGPNGPVSQFVLKTDRFFVVKDPAGNIYKLKFTGGANTQGERGYPTFQYIRLQ